jgi:hypothetical protein
MRKLISLGCGLLLLSLPVSGEVVRGTLLNDDDPYFIGGDDANIYKAEWYWGSTLFYEDDRVILTDNVGAAEMVDDKTDETADVLVEEISPVRGTLLNDNEPYIVRGDAGGIYKVERYGGSSSFWEGDQVTLSNDHGPGEYDPRWPRGSRPGGGCSPFLYFIGVPYNADPP